MRGQIADRHNSANMADRAAATPAINTLLARLKGGDHPERGIIDALPVAAAIAAHDRRQ